MADPSLTTVLNSTLEALKPDSCARAVSAPDSTNSTVWDQIKNFLSSFSENPAGASLSVSVVVIAAVTVYILLKYIHHRVENLPMRAARVWEFAQTMRNFMERLVPGSDTDLQVDDLANLAVPDPDVIVALERGTGQPAADPQTDYYSPVENSDPETYSTPFDSTRRTASLRRVKEELNTPLARPARSVPRMYPSVPSLPRTLEYPPPSAQVNSGRTTSATVHTSANAEKGTSSARRFSSTTTPAERWRQPAPQALDSTDEEVVFSSQRFCLEFCNF